MKKKVIVVGTGGHAKVVIDILLSMIDVEIIGLTAKELPVGSEFFGQKVLGNDSILLPMYKNKEFDFVAMGVGGFRDNSLRKKIFSAMKGQGLSFISVIHPTAYISKSSKIGEGSIIFPNVSVNTEVEIGMNSIIATGATIDHESILGNNVLISAGVTIGGNVQIKDDSLVALGAKVISGLKIGTNTLIGAGAVVVKDIPDNHVALGLPAKSKEK